VNYQAAPYLQFWAASYIRRNIGPTAALNGRLGSQAIILPRIFRAAVLRCEAALSVNFLAPVSKRPEAAISRKGLRRIKAGIS